MKNILILGGSVAGVSTAHRILKQAPRTGPFKITLVSPDTHLYWNMASARAIVPGQITDEKLFQPVAPGFEQYPASQFEFILASAKSLDIEAKKVEVSGSSGNQTLSYDLLIIATGSKANGGTPFKGLGSTEATKDALHDFQARVQNAHTIVVAGAGVTGIEVAGELKFEYGEEKEIILISSSQILLKGTPPTISKTTIEALQKMNVDLRLGTRVLDAAEMPGGQHQVTLSNGEKLVADMYIQSVGLIPNSSYIPAKFLDAHGFVAVDEYLRVKGADDVWAIGDVSALEPAQFIHCNRQSAHLAKNLILILNKKAPLSYKVTTSRFQIGRNFATGHWGSMQLPGFLILWARKALFMEKIGPMISGSAF